MMPSGFRIQYPSLRRVSTGYEYAADYRAYRAGNSKNFTKIYSGKVAQNITQALAAYVIRQQMAEIGKHYKVAFQVHDEVIVVVPSDNALADQQAIEQIMSTPPL